MPTPVSTASAFGQALRARRKAVGITQSELALAVGTTRRLISALENGTRGISLQIALAAAAELGLDLVLEGRS